ACSRSSASSRSRVRRAITVSRSVAAERCFGAAFGGLVRFGFVALRRSSFAVLPPAFERLFMPCPRPGLAIVAGQTSALEVGFGSATQLAAECRHWVDSGHSALIAECPVYPQRRTLRGRRVRSAWCRTHAVQQNNDYSIPRRRALRSNGDR